MIMEKSNQLAAADGSQKIRCAVYTRYSSDLQRPASSEDQIRNCRAGAREKGWTVLDEFIRSDEEQTGRTMIGREGLADLMRLAKQRPKPFDCILIDDTSRLGRYLPDVLRECDTLMLHDVFIYFVSDRLDSRDESFRIVHLVKGYGDERYSKDLAKKIHRGQEGCIRKGYTAGGSYYGYKNKYLRDPNQKGDHGEARVIGVEQEIVPEQAAAVVRIMEMRASGFSFSKIAKTLNAEGAPAPRRMYKGRIQDYWVPSSIREITKNELYHGVRLWNRTRKELNPSDGTKVMRTKPQSEWVRVEVPGLRIVSEELWEQVRQVNQRTKDKFYGRRQGGFNRTEASRTYLFSGAMFCGLCGGKFSVIIGGKRCRYGCPNHRFRNTCTNKVTILRNRLEQQLIAAISKNLLDARLEQQRVQDFSAELRAAIEVEEKLAAEATLQTPKVKAERADLEQQAGRLADAIRQHGFSSFLSAELTKLESRIAEIDRLLTVKPTSKPTTFTDEQIAEFLRQECQNFCDALAGDAEFARREIQKHIRSLVLTPKDTPDGLVLEVSGDVALLRTRDVLVESPMEGIAQQYIGASISLAGVRLDPSLPLAA
jgi:DNA invertase Pin-like site-specific DNA recombinase